MPTSRSSAITPSAARLTESLRDIGYDFPSAVADIVDKASWPTRAGWGS